MLYGSDLYEVLNYRLRGPIGFRQGSHGLRVPREWALQLDSPRYCKVATSVRTFRIEFSGLPLVKYVYIPTYKHTRVYTHINTSASIEKYANIFTTHILMYNSHRRSSPKPPVALAHLSSRQMLCKPNTPGTQLISNHDKEVDYRV